jgi:hypothetical protein
LEKKLLHHPGRAFWGGVIHRQKRAAQFTGTNEFDGAVAPNQPQQGAALLASEGVGWIVWTFATGVEAKAAVGVWRSKISHGTALLN